MNIDLFISRRLFFDKANKKLLSQRIIRIALAGIAMGLAVMIVSLAVVTGFQNEIKDKVIGFGSHIQVVNFDSNNSFETQPVSKKQPFIPLVKEINDIKHIQVFATKPGMIKTDDYIHGIVLKGVSTDYSWEFLSKYLIKGKLPALNDSVSINEILISEQISKLLQIKLNDQAIFYFINEKNPIPLVRQLKVCGIYRSGLEEMDNVFVFGDIKKIQHLNNWNSEQISGFEILVSDFYQIEKIEQEVRDKVIECRDENSEILRTQSITRMWPQIFDWLRIIDMNVWIILILMVLVAGFNMISGLLVLLLERASMIGVLKAMGSPNWSIRKVFIYLSVFLTARGMLWGNVIGILIVVIQNTFHLLRLDPTSYYVEFVPMNFSIIHLLLLNVGTIICTSLILIIPSYFVSRISPDKTIRFE